jgi:hypothetical protein
MDIIEEIESEYKKTIPCILTDEHGNNWAAHGLIMSGYYKGYIKGKEDLALVTKLAIEREMNPNDSVVVVKKG